MSRPTIIIFNVFFYYYYSTLIMLRFLMKCNDLSTSISTFYILLAKHNFYFSTISNVSISCATTVNTEDPGLPENNAEYCDEDELSTCEESSHKASPSLIDTSGTYGEKRSRSNTDKLAVVLSKGSKERDAILQTIQNQNELSLNPEQNQDDVDLFLKSIAKNVKQLPKKGISEAKLKILSLVTELEEKYTELTMSIQDQPISFVETSKSTLEINSKLFNPYDKQNNTQVSTQFHQYNNDGNYIFPL